MVLVTEYEVEMGDTLNQYLLAEIAYGYGVVPIFYRRQGQSGKVMPSDDIRLHPGDKLVILGTIRGLRRIERGQRLPQRWQVHVEQVMSMDARFEGATELTQISGCQLGTAREFMQQLPATFPYKLYRHQALRLVRRLMRSQVKAYVIAPVSMSSEELHHP
jgi:hypothetical protein